MTQEDDADGHPLPGRELRPMSQLRTAAGSPGQGGDVAPTYPVPVLWGERLSALVTGGDSPQDRGPGSRALLAEGQGQVALGIDWGREDPVIITAAAVDQEEAQRLSDRIAMAVVAFNAGLFAVSQTARQVGEAIVEAERSAARMRWAEAEQVEPSLWLRRPLKVDDLLSLRQPIVYMRDPFDGIANEHGKAPVHMRHADNRITSFRKGSNTWTPRTYGQAKASRPSRRNRARPRK